MTETEEIKRAIDRRAPRNEAWGRSESELQILVVSSLLPYLNEFPELELMHSIPNGDWRGFKTAKKLKAEGLKPGIPDISLPIPRGGYHGMYLELKNARGSVKADQWRIMIELHKHGYFVALTNSLTKAQCLVLQYLEGEINRF